MVNVVVGRKKKIQVSVNASANVIETTTPVTLKNMPVLTNAASVNRIDKLEDVIATGEVDGATLVYNEQLDRYVVEFLDMSHVTGIVDGGVF